MARTTTTCTASYSGCLPRRSRPSQKRASSERVLRQELLDTELRRRQRQLGLGVARVRVQVGGALGAAVFVAEPAGSGDVQEQIGGPAEALHRLPARAVVGAVGRADGKGV